MSVTSERPRWTSSAKTPDDVNPLFRWLSFCNLSTAKREPWKPHQAFLSRRIDQGGFAHNVISAPGAKLSSEADNPVSRDALVNTTFTVFSFYTLIRYLQIPVEIERPRVVIVLILLRHLDPPSRWRWRRRCRPRRPTTRPALVLHEPRLIPRRRSASTSSIPQSRFVTRAPRLRHPPFRRRVRGDRVPAPVAPRAARSRDGLLAGS